MVVLKPDTEKKRKIVEQWLDSLGFTHEQRAATSDQEWGIAATDDTGFVTNIFWRKPPANSILVVAEMAFPAVYQQAFTLMGVSDRLLFLGDIGRCLHAHGVSHALLTEDKDDEEDDLPPPKGINIFVNMLADDGISRPVFFDRYHLIRAKAQEIALLFQRMALLRRWV